LYQFRLRMSTHEECGEQMRRKFGFCVSWRHVYDQTLQFAFCNAVQLLRIDFMVVSLYEIGPNGLHEGQKVILVGLLLVQYRFFEDVFQSLGVQTFQFRNVFHFLKIFPPGVPIITFLHVIVTLKLTFRFFKACLSKKGGRGSELRSARARI